MHSLFKFGVWLPLVGMSLTQSGQAQSCTPVNLQNPFGNPVFGLMEWNGDYYDGGWFHLRRRPVAGGAWQSVGGGITGPGANTLAGPMVDFEGQLIVAGSFFNAGGVPANNIVAWDGNSYSALGSGLNSEVEALVVWDGKLVAGGSFTSNGSGSVTLERVAIFDPQVGTWAPLGDGLGDLPAGFSTFPVADLTVHDGDLYATGRFRQSGPTSVNGVARWNVAADAWESLGSGIAGMNAGNVGLSLASFDGELWMSGFYQSVGGTNSPFMASWDGSAWNPSPAGPDGHSLVMTIFGGQLYASGIGAFRFGGSTFDLARFDGQTWQPVGNFDDGFAGAMGPDASGTSLLFGGTFSSFEGATVGSNMMRLDCESSIGTRYCVANANSTGSPSSITASGSASIAANDLVLSADSVPNQPGLFFYGPTQLQNPFGNGFRCVGGTIGRLDIVAASGGALTFAVDNTQPPSAAVTLTAGSTWNFQAWFRDPAAGGSSFNLSDGLEIDFSL